MELILDAEPVIQPYPHPVNLLKDSDWKVRRWCNPTSDPFTARSSMTQDRLVREPKCTLWAGPILLARSKRIGSTEEEMFSSPSVFGRDCSCTLKRTDGSGQCEFLAELHTSTGTAHTRVCDFASAGNALLDDPAYFSVWF